MICEEVLGKLKDDKFKGLVVDYVDIDWFEAFSRLHRKTSRGGEDVAIKMGHDILHKGLNQDDVIYADDSKVIAVNIPECEAIKAIVREDHPGQIAKLCYEVGNTHTSMFRGEDAFTFYIPFNQPMLDKVQSIHGVDAEKVTRKFDFSQALSSSINDHHH